MLLKRQQATSHLLALTLTPYLRTYHAPLLFSTKKRGSRRRALAALVRAQARRRDTVVQHAVALALREQRLLFLANVGQERLALSHLRSSEHTALVSSIQLQQRRGLVRSIQRFSLYHSEVYLQHREVQYQQHREVQLVSQRGLLSRRCTYRALVVVVPARARL